MLKDLMDELAEEAKKHSLMCPEHFVSVLLILGVEYSVMIDIHQSTPKAYEYICNREPENAFEVVVTFQNGKLYEEKNGQV
jgi:hypothetical protein